LSPSLGPLNVARNFSEDDDDTYFTPKFHAARSSLRAHCNAAARRAVPATATAYARPGDRGRGLFGVFSTGMDQMAAQLKAQGYSNVSLWSWTDVEQISHDIIAGHQNGDNAHVILIGHSLGSNAVVQVADRVGSQAIPVDLAVTFDITEGLQVPLNVQRFENFYQNNGFGRPAIEPAGFTGEFNNINLSNDTRLSHGNIDNAPQLQQIVMQQVYDITHTHVRTRMAKRKEPRQG
jgi:hypothetical protein